MKKKKKIIALVGPSGSGKTSIGKSMEKMNISPIVSTTTRAKRLNEVEGKDYYFLTKEEFNQTEKIEEVEYAGNQYGFTKNAVFQAFKNNQTMSYVVINYHGYQQFVEFFKNYDDIEVIMIYIKIGEEEIRERLLLRGENEAFIEQRIAQAVKEDEFNRENYADYVLENRLNQYTLTMHKLTKILDKINKK